MSNQSVAKGRLFTLLVFMISIGILLVFLAPPPEVAKPLPNKLMQDKAFITLPNGLECLESSGMHRYALTCNWEKYNESVRFESTIEEY